MAEVVPVTLSPSVGTRTQNASSRAHEVRAQRTRPREKGLPMKKQVIAVMSVAVAFAFAGCGGSSGSGGGYSTGLAPGASTAQAPVTQQPAQQQQPVQQQQPAAPQISISGVTPNTGPAGTQITIVGTALDTAGVTDVQIGGVSCTNIQVA